MNEKVKADRETDLVAKCDDKIAKKNDEIARRNQEIDDLKRQLEQERSRQVNTIQKVNENP